MSSLWGRHFSWKPHSGMHSLFWKTWGKSGKLKDGEQSRRKQKVVGFVLSGNIGAFPAIIIAIISPPRYATVYKRSS